ncbi:hypothetical protein EUTSA_v10012003mg, partial [Eutrema salsugineum]
IAETSFRSWATKMAALHKPTWRKAGIFDAVMASIYNIYKDVDLVLGIAEKWCPETKTFVFPWGETTITLEDVMVLLGFSVLGSPVCATLDSSGEMMKEKLEKEWLQIKKDQISFVSQAAWMRRFKDSGDELEHAAFLALWLSYFVYPSRFYHIYEAILPISVHLSSGTRIALAPAVLAHLYAELSLLKNHIRAFTESTITVKANLSALFKLVQVWTWERFKELQPKPNPLLKGEPRLALWDDLKQRTSRDARQILDNCKIESFEWRPYTKTLKKWEFPKFYPEKEMWVPVGPNLEDDFISFARCVKVSELVGIESVELYFPNRVASQFGMVQNEAASTQYDKPIDDLMLFIPSRSAIPRVTPMFCEWWRKSFPQFQNSSKEKDVVESAETLNSRTVIGGDTSNFVPSGSKMSRTSRVGIKIAEDLTNKKRKCMKLARAKRWKYMNRVREDGSKMKRTSEDGTKRAKDSAKKRSQYMKRARDKRRKYLKQALDKRRQYMKRARENDESNIGCCQTQVPSDNNDEDVSLTIAQIMRLGKNKYNGGDASEPLGKKSRLEVDNNDSGPLENVASVTADGDETVTPTDIEERNEETGDIGSKTGKNTVLSPIYENNSSDPPLGFDEEIDILVSPPETRQTCDDELDVYGSNVEKMTMTNGRSKEPECLLHEDGAMAGEKERSAEKEDDLVDDGSLIQEKLALNVDNIEPTLRQKLVSGGLNGEETPDESNIHIAVGDGTQGYDCLLTALGSEETLKSNEQLENLEKRNGGVGEGDVGNDSFEKSLHSLKVLASSMEERITKAQRNVAWLKERRAMKQRKIASARLI